MPFDQAPSAVREPPVTSMVMLPAPRSSVVMGDVLKLVVVMSGVRTSIWTSVILPTARLHVIIDVRPVTTSPSHRLVWAAASPALRTRANPKASAAAHPHSHLRGTPVPAALATMGLVREGGGAAAFIWWNRIGRKDVGGRVEIAGCVASLPVPTCNHTDLLIHDGTFFLLSRSGGDVPHEAPAPSATKECHRRR